MNHELGKYLEGNGHAEVSAVLAALNLRHLFFSETKC
jgi:hypothetical protein